MSDKAEGSKNLESAEKQEQPSKQASDASVIDGSDSGKSNKQVHELTQERHDIGESATNLLTPKPNESIEDFTKRSLEAANKERSSMGLVDGDKGIVHTGSGMLPVLPEDISLSYQEHLKAIDPAKSEPELQERVAKATMDWMQSKNMTGEKTRSRGISKQKCCIRK